MAKLVARNSSILVKPIIEEEKTSGNIIIPDLGKSKYLKGTVISVGPGWYTAMGNLIPSELKVGDIVLLPQLGPTSVTFEDEEYWGCDEKMILGTIEN